MTASLRRRRLGAVEVVTVDRPDRRNALDPPTISALARAVREVTADPPVGAMVLTAVGTESFGSGMDLAALAADRAEAAGAVTELREAMWGDDRVPMVAAVNGAARAGGFELALRCDLVVAADHATFGLPEVTRGMVAGGGATLLPARIPVAVALELGLTGDPIDAARAYELGLVNRVVPGPEVLDLAVELAGRVAANAPLAVAWTRRAMWAALDGVDAGWRVTEAGQAVVGASEDLAEGLAAFRDKRAPRWRGR